MPIIRFHCPFVGLSGCHDGSGNGLTKSSLITHLRDRHCNVDAQAITKQSLTTNLAVFEEAEVTFKRMGVWLCGVCFKTHTLRSKCRHGSSDFVPPPDCGDGIVRFVLYDLTKPSFPSSSVPLDHVDVLGQNVHGGFTLTLLDHLLSKGLRTVKSIPPKCRLGFSRVLKGALDKVICTPDDISCWVSLLVLPICLLKTFRPRSNLECKSASKRQHQEECIASGIRSWGTPGGSLQLLRETLAEPTPLLSDIDISDGDHDLSKRNMKQCKRKICDGHYTAAVRVLSSSGVAPYNEATLDDLKTKHPFKSAPFLPHTPIDHHQLMASPGLVLDMIRSFPRGTSCGRDGLRAQHLMDCFSGAAVAISEELLASITQVVNLFLDGKCPKRLGEYIASAPLTPLVKPGGGIRPIAVGTIWRRLVSKVCATTIGHSLDTYLNDLQFGVGVSGGGEAILHAVNRLIEDRNDDIGLSMLLVDFQNAFNLVDREIMLQEVRIRCPAISHWVEFCYSNPARLYYGEHTLWSHQSVQQGDPLGPLHFSLVLHPLIRKIKDSFSLSLHAWYLDDGTIIGDTLVMGKVLELIMKDGPHRGLHLNVNKMEVFWPREDPRSRLASVFPPTIAHPLHGVKLLGGLVSVDFGFSSELVLKRVAKSIELMDAAAKLNDPQCELLLLRACAGISKLYFSMRTCSPQVFERAQHSFDAALRSSLERIVTASGPGFGDWQWRLATLPFAFGGLGVYCAGDVLSYAFLASRLQSASLQTKLLRHSGIVSSGLAFDSALNAFNVKMEIDLLSNSSEIAAPKLMKKLADIYFTSVTQMAESTFSLSTRQMALWKSQMEDHTSDWLRVVPISGLGQTMNGRTYRCVLCYRLGVPLFSVSKPCSACSRVFIGDIYGDHAVSCAGIVGIKHRHNVVRDTLVDICYRSGISSGKEVNIGLDGEHDKSLRPADVLLYSWDVGRDVCVDLTGSSPLTQTGMVDFVPGRAVTEAAQRKRVKYEAKCADIGYGFLPFSFSSFGELEKDAVTLLKRIRKFSMAQDMGARAAVYIFNRISFSIAKGPVEDPRGKVEGVAKLSYALRTCSPLSLMEVQVQFDKALRTSLEKIVTTSGPGFGDCNLQANILSRTGIMSHGSSLQNALDAFNDICNVDILSVTTSASAPQMMKTLAKCYFGAIENDLISRYALSPRQVAILSCIRAPHAQDFLLTIPIDGLGQKMNHRQFRFLLCYRLTIPMVSKGSVCSSCNVHRMDKWGDHAVHCSSEVGVKFRHNLVRDILVDICSKVGIMVRKEAPMGFRSGDGKDLRPADLLLFNWFQGKDACLDVIGTSPYAGMGANSWPLR
ncbi:putative reverse transcriptase domain-containing protein [Tanacetum coccineum]